MPIETFYQKVRRTSAKAWLRLVYSMLDQRDGVITLHHPLDVLRCAERSVPGLDGMVVQHAFALSIFFPNGPRDKALPRPELDFMVSCVSTEQLHALRPVQDIWPDRASRCSHCGADLTEQPKRRACKGCNRPAYCGKPCQRG